MLFPHSKQVGVSQIFPRHSSPFKANWFMQNLPLAFESPTISASSSVDKRITLEMPTEEFCVMHWMSKAVIT